MADRSISISLEAKVSGLVNGLRTAQQATKDFGSRTLAFAKEHEQSMDRVGKAGATLGLGLLGGVALAVKSFAEFDKAMSGVEAATHETAGNMELLRQAAIDAGADTAFSAAEAAQGIEELSKAGVKTKDILNGGLTGALNLAAAGGLSVGESAEIAASAMTQFGLSGDKVTHIADLLAAGAGKAQGSVHDMGEALNQAGLVADQTGLSIEETTGGLAAFASAGLTGSDAGTSFKTMLQRLTPTSKEASEKMDELGIHAYDAQGNFIGLEKFAGNLKDSMKSLTPEARNTAMSIIFGSDAVRAANVLYENGAEGIEKWTAAVDDAGFAAETAALKQDNLAGDFEKLTGSLDSVFLKSGSGANEVLRKLVQNAEDFVDAIGKIPTPVLEAAVGIAAVTGGTALLGGAFLTALPKIQEGIASFRELEKSAPRMASALKGAGLVAAITAISLAIAKIASAANEANVERSVAKTTEALVEMAKQKENIQATAEALNYLFQTKDGGELIKGVKDIDSALTRTFKKDFFQTINDSADDALRGLGLDTGKTAKAVTDSFKTIDDQLSEFVKSGNADLAAKAFTKIEDKARAQGVTVDQLKTVFPGYFEALKQVDADAKVAAESIEKITNSAGQSVPMTDEMKKALEDLGLSAAGTVTELDKYAAALVRAGLSNLSTRDAARNYEAAIDAVDAALKTNGKTLDIHTEKGRANQAALDAVAQAGLSEVEAMAKATDAYGNHIYTSDQLHAKMQTTYTDLVNNGKKFGLTAGQADELARKTLGIPKGVNIQAYLKDFASKQLDNLGIKADNLNGKSVTVYAQADISAAQAALDHLRANSMITANQYASGNAYRKSAGGIIPEYRADGGLINYLATGGFPKFTPYGTDTVPAMLTPGEFVVNREATAENLTLLQAINSGRNLTPAKSWGGTDNGQPLQMTGTLTMDSGEVLGVFHGVATRAANQVMDSRSSGAARQRGGR